jgi:predicted peroxiredoxin
MGLELARSALEAGSSVVVFLNVEAAELAKRDLGADVKFADFPPIADQLGSVIAKGGRVYVCGHCAAVMNLGQDQIAPGIVIAKHGDILEAVRPGMVGFSY